MFLYKFGITKEIKILLHKSILKMYLKQERMHILISLPIRVTYTVNMNLCKGIALNI